MKALFDDLSIRCSRLTTGTYSTSFSIGILCLERKLRDPIHAIYGFVRFADEIVDSMHDYDRAKLLDEFASETYKAIHEKISLNPILNSFQFVVNKYGISHELIARFLMSMEMDLTRKKYDQAGYENYILGSAEVVGLMCLRVFVQGDEKLYDKLAPFAMKLGSAFQKVNFLRDLNADYHVLGRMYFPRVENAALDADSKCQIESDITRDFSEARKGIQQLPRSSRLGVYVAYVYYLALFKKIKNTTPQRILTERIRIRNRHKATLLAFSLVRYQLNRL